MDEHCILPVVKWGKKGFAAPVCKIVEMEVTKQPNPKIKTKKRPKTKDADSFEGEEKLFKKRYPNFCHGNGSY